MPKTYLMHKFHVILFLAVLNTKFALSCLSMNKPRNLVDGTRSNSSPSMLNRKYAAQQHCDNQSECTLCLSDLLIHVVGWPHTSHWVPLGQHSCDHILIACQFLSQELLCHQQIWVMECGLCRYNKEERTKYRALWNPIVNLLYKIPPCDIHVALCVIDNYWTTEPNQTWEIGRVSMKTRRYVGNPEDKKSLRNMKNCWV